MKTLSARGQLVQLTVAHGVVDSYALSVPFLLPILVARFAPSDQRELYAGALAATVSVSTSIGQVGFAYLADRIRSAPFLWLGLAVGAVGMSLLGRAPSLGVAAFLMVFGGLGVAAFHPPSAMAARRLSKEAKGFGMSVFIFGGNVGQAAGPLALMFAYSRWSDAVFLPAMIPGVALALMTIKPFTRIARDNGLPETSDEGQGRMFNVSLFILWLIVTLRTLTMLGFMNFLSLYLDEQELSHNSRSLVLSGFLLLGSIGMLVGGGLSDRYPRMRLLMASLILPIPLFLLALASSGLLFSVSLLAGNFIFQLTTPLYIVMGQETMSRPTNVATSLVMGGAWGTAGLLNLPAGAVANHVGLAPTLTGFALLPLASVALLLLLPKGATRTVEAPVG